jgi:DNA polymerase-3 subunit beta
MDCTINSEVFARDFNRVAAIAPTRSPRESLCSIKVTITNDHAILEATDTETSVRVLSHCLSGVKQTGVVLIPAALGSKIFRKLASDTFRMTVSKNGMSVVADKAKFQIACHNVDEFPSISPTPNDHSLAVPVRVFADAVRATSFAVDIESSRYALGSVLFEHDDDEFSAIASDGRRMSVFRHSVECRYPVFPVGQTLVPVKAAVQLSRIVKSAGEEIVEMSVSKNEFVVKCGDVVACARLMEGRFPAWRQVFSTSSVGDYHEAIIPAAEFSDLIQMASVVTKEDSRGILLAFSENKLQVKSSNSEVGETDLSAEISYTGVDVELQLDCSYLSDGCRVVGSDGDVVLKVKKPALPIFVEDGRGFCYLVQPMVRKG